MVENLSINIFLKPEQKILDKRNKPPKRVNLIITEISVFVEAIITWLYNVNNLS